MNSIPGSIKQSSVDCQPQVGECQLNGSLPRGNRRVLQTILLLILTTFSLFVSPAIAVENPGKALEDVGIDTSKRGTRVDLDLPFVNAEGQKKTLREFALAGKPVLLTPVYYHCPRLCGLFLNGFVKLLNELKLRPGTDFQILTVSIDPEEGPELAAKRKKEFVGKLTSDKAYPNWEFLTGSKENVHALMKQVGFRYMPDGEEFAHTAAFIILTPEGEISQYFTGIDFSAWDAKLAIVDASKGAIGSAIDHILLYCFRFDPTSGKYTWAAFNVMRSGVILSVLAMGAFVYVSLRKA
jgi:protein SCO1